MKGLLLKDFYCLKNSLKSFCVLTLGVIVIGVMFAISIRHGNMAVAVEETVANGDMTAEGMYDMFRMGVWLVLLIPIAFVGSIEDCFKADRNAKFDKQLFSMPVKTSQIVGARYLACLIYAGVGVSASVIAAICISSATKHYPLSELLAVIGTFAAVFVALQGLSMMMNYLMAGQYVKYVQTVAIIIGYIVIVICMNTVLGDMSEEQMDVFMVKAWENTRNFLTQYTGIFCVVALVVFGIAYCISVRIVEKRRGKAIC